MSNQIGSLKMGQKYKKTPIGEIPVDWECARLSEVANINMGQSPESSSCNDVGDGIPFYQGNADFGRLYPTPSSWCQSPTKVAAKGDILISVRAPVGEVNIAPHECCIGRGLSAIRAKGIDARYLYYSLISSSRALDKLAQGSTFKAINGGDLTDLPISIPTAGVEQKKIGDILWSVDELIEKITCEIEKSKVLKKGLMRQLLTRGIGHKKFKKTEIGAMPESWECLALPQIVVDKRGAIKIGPFGSQLKKSDLSESGYKVYGQENIIANDFTLGNRFVSEEKFQQLKSFELLPGDLAITMMGTIGLSRLVPENLPQGLMDSHLLRLTLERKKVVPEYVGYCIHEYDVVKRQIQSMSQGGIMSGLNSAIIKSIQLPIPSIEEQREIVDIFGGLDADIEHKEAALDKMRMLKSGLMCSLLTGKVRV